MRIEPNHTYAATARSEQQSTPPAQPAVSENQIQEFLQQLQETYSFVNFDMESLSDTQAVEDYALLAGKGMHLVISPDFLRFMQENDENMMKGMSILHKALQELTKQGIANLLNGGSGAVVQEDGKISFWASHTAEQESESSQLVKQLELMRLQQKNARNNMQNLPKRKVTYSASAISNRITSANTVYSVHSAMGQAYGSLMQLERCKTDNRYDRAAVSRAIAHAKNAIAAAKVKIRNLENEEITRKQIIKAAEKKQRRKEEQLKYTLEKNRKSNRSREYGMLRKCNLEYFSPLNREYEQDYQHELPGSGTAEMTGGIELSGMTAISGMPAGAEIASTGSGVTVSAPVDLG